MRLTLLHEAYSCICRGWSDVDELDDVDRLEEYITESAVVIVLLKVNSDRRIVGENFTMLWSYQ